MQPLPYQPTSQSYSYGAPPPPQQPYGAYPPPPPLQQQQQQASGCYAPMGYANYPSQAPPPGGCYALSQTGPRPPPPQPPMQQGCPGMPPNLPPAPNYACGGPGYPPNAVPVNNYDPRRNDYRY